MKYGRFIVLEGGEGAGKSTQAKLLADKLAASGQKTHLTREVGGAPLAEEIRKFWLADRAEKWDATTEVLLIFAARREHLVKTVWPMLKHGTWVICDRFVDSTLVYQGDGMGLDHGHIHALYAMTAGDFVPDLTLILDLPVATAQQRIAARQLDRYERKGADFHEKLREGFMRLAQETPDRRKIVDATQPQEHVQDAIWRYVHPLLSRGL
ncbi:MAG: dTMP kinase [Alphaproteobacteria bacterium]